jgi:hypothetical protein
MSDPEFPPFIYENMTIHEYIEQTVKEKSIPEIKQQIEFLVDFILDQVQYPFEDREMTFLYVRDCCKAIRGLMRNGIPPQTRTPGSQVPEETVASCGEVSNSPCE